MLRVTPSLNMVATSISYEKIISKLIDYGKFYDRNLGSRIIKINGSLTISKNREYSLITVYN